MKRFLHLLLLVSTVALGQVKFPAKYVPIPAAPSAATTSPTTIVPGDFCCSSPGLFNYTLVGGVGAGGNVKTSGAFTAGFSARQFDGDASHIYRFVNTAGDVYGTTGTGQNHGVSTTDHGNFLQFYGLDATHPIITTGENGFQLPSASGGANLLVQNAVAKSPNASGLTANFGVSSTNYYDTFVEKFFRAFNTGQEGICYLGNTGASYDGTNYHNNVSVTNCFSYNSQREGVQVEHVNNLWVSNVTCILPGQTATAGQRNGMQVHDCNGNFNQFILDGSPFPGNIFTHGVRISNGYWGFTEGAGFIGRTDNAYFSASARLNGDSLIFENLYFNYTGVGTLAYVWLIEERVANIIFRNCTFSTNITAIFSDNRVAGFSNTITGTIGTQGNVSAAITAPVYVSGYSDPDNPYAHGLLARTSPYHPKHYGYRTP